MKKAEKKVSTFSPHATELEASNKHRENVQKAIGLQTEMMDVSKLITVGNYARQISRDRQRVYQMIEEGKVEAVEINGVKFIVQK